MALRRTISPKPKLVTARLDHFHSSDFLLGELIAYRAVRFEEVV